MVALTKRQREALRFLCGQHDFVTVDRLAAALDVSNRTMRSDLKRCQAYAREHGAPLELKQGNGVRLAADGAARRALLSGLDACVPSTFDAVERTAVAAALVLAKQPCTFQELADVCAVSRQTLINGFGDVEALLAQHGVSVNRQPGVGCSAHGGESGIRRCFLQLAVDGATPPPAHDILRTSGGLAAYVPPAHGLVAKAQACLGNALADTTQLETALAFTLKRIAEGHLLEPSPAHAAPLVDESLSAVSDLLAEDIDEPRERAYIASLILTARVEHAMGGETDADVGTETGANADATADAKARANGEPSAPLAPDERANATRDIAHLISTELVEALRHVHRIEDDRVRNVMDGLALHMRAAIQRWRNGIQIQDEFSQRIVSSIPLIYEFTKRQMREAHTRWGIDFNESELAYIAMYLASIYESSAGGLDTLRVLFVCSFGLASSAILKSRLAATLSECELAGPLSPEGALRYMQEHEVDLVVSTTDLEADAPVIVVDPLLGATDVERISDLLARRSYEKLCGRFLHSLARSEGREAREVHYVRDYVAAGDIQLIDYRPSWQDAIRIAAAPLLERGVVEPRYVEAMIAAVERFGAYMVLTPGCAYVHAGTGDGIHENCAAILVLPDEIPFGTVREKYVRTVVVLGMHDTSRTDLLNLASIFDREETVLALGRARSPGDVLDLHD